MRSVGLAGTSSFPAAAVLPTSTQRGARVRVSVLEPAECGGGAAFNSLFVCLRRFGPTSSGACVSFGRASNGSDLALISHVSLIYFPRSTDVN